jgi:hypothetical protein
METDCSTPVQDNSLSKLIDENCGSFASLAFALAAWRAEHADEMNTPRTKETQARLLEVRALVAALRAQQNVEDKGPEVVESHSDTYPE